MICKNNVIRKTSFTEVPECMRHYSFPDSGQWSLFSALWNRAESVELILPNGGKQNFRTKKHFSYYKFFVPDDVDHFRLTMTSCTVTLQQRSIGLHDGDCIDYVAIRGKVSVKITFQIDVNFTKLICTFIATNTSYSKTTKFQSLFCLPIRYEYLSKRTTQFCLISINEKGY